MKFIRPGSEANETKFSKLLRGWGAGGGGGGGGGELVDFRGKKTANLVWTKSSLSFNQIFYKCIHFLESENSSYTCKLHLPNLLN